MRKFNGRKRRPCLCKSFIKNRRRKPLFLVLNASLSSLITFHSRNYAHTQHENLIQINTCLELIIYQDFTRVLKY